MGIAIDNSENAYIIDGTSLVRKINSEGSAIVYSYNTGDNINAIAVDGQGDAFVTGSTNSSIVGTSFLQGCTFGNFAFLSKINPTGTSSYYSITFGGTSRSTPSSCFDAGTGIAVDNSGNAFVTGFTGDFDFPVTKGAFQTTLRGYVNAFAIKVNPFGTDLIYSTYLGGNGYESNFGDDPCSPAINAIAVDSSGNAFVAGCTSSTDFPVTPDAFQPNNNMATQDSFFSIIDASGSNLLYSTYLGGSGLVGNEADYWSLADAIAVDALGNATLAGVTSSPDFPTTSGALQQGFSSDNYNKSGFITRFKFSQGLLAPSVSPQYVGNSGVVSLTIFLPNGVSLDNIPSVVLTAPDEPDIPATSVVMVDGHHILATFDLTGADPVARTLVITYPGGDIVTLQQALDVIAGGAPGLWADIVGFSSIRPEQPQTYYLMYGNHGTVDSQQPFTLWVTFPSSLSWTTPVGLVPSTSYSVGTTTVLAFDVFDTVPVGGSRVIPLTITLHADVGFQIDMWSPSF
jgi:hypothetical protein